MWGSAVDNLRVAPLTVFSARGSGGVLVEAALTLASRPYRLRDVALFPDEVDGSAEQAANTALLTEINPLRQAPTVVLGGDADGCGGRVLTESAALLLWIADLHPEARLAPDPGDPERPEFLRWMAYLPGQIYPMYWVKDAPERLAGADPAQQMAIVERAIARIEDCWRAFGAQVGAPRSWLGGEHLSVLDLYVAVLSRWSPGRRTFYGLAPKLADVVRRVDGDPRLQALWADRFPFTPGWER